MDRPRIHLQDKDLIYFLHVPRTAGASFYQVLASQFPADQSLRADSREALETTLRSTDAETISRYRLIGGPCDANVARFVRRMPLFLTTIREPISRVMSQYELIKTTPNHRFHGDVTEGRMTFMEYLRHPEGGVRQGNRQVRLIAEVRASRRQRDDAKIDPWALLELAREHLEDFTFFGLCDRFEDSVRLAAHMFHWKPIDEIPHVNATRSRNNRLRLSAREIELASEQNQLDIYLYDMARKVFCRRFSELESEPPRREPGVAAVIHG